MRKTKKIPVERMATSATRIQDRDFVSPHYSSVMKGLIRLI